MELVLKVVHPFFCTQLVNSPRYSTRKMRKPLNITFIILQRPCIQLPINTKTNKNTAAFKFWLYDYSDMEFLRTRTN
uniref:Uncharacterized protein n=1 Tax=Anguilla anguilla TaxID=7936 RepID=A0A0E9WZ84_ANGAN